MGILKFRNVIGKELEIEGEEEVVLKLIDKYTTPSAHINAGGQGVDKLSTTLAEAIVKVRPRVEAEWLVIYAYYLDKPEFARQELLEQYRLAKRFSENRRKNLSFNLKVAIKKGWFNAISANVFSMAPEGRIKAMESLKEVIY